MFLFTEDMIVYLENPNKSINKLLELINGFSMVFRHKVTIQKSNIFLYSNSKMIIIWKILKQSHFLEALKIWNT